MGQQFHDNKLEEALNDLFDEMVKKKLIPEGVDKKTTVANLVKNLGEKSDCNLDMSDLKNPAFQKTLALAIVGECVNQKKPGTIDYALLFKKDPLNDKALKEKLTLEIEKLLLFTYKNNPKITPEFCKQFAAKIVDKMMDEVNKDDEQNQDRLSKNEAATNILQELLAATLTLRNLYGGEDPSMTGEIVFPVLVAVTNTQGFVFLGSVNFNDNSVMNENSRYDAGKVDSTGKEASALASVLSLGITQVCADMADSLTSLARNSAPSNERK